MAVFNQDEIAESQRLKLDDVTLEVINIENSRVGENEKRLYLISFKSWVEESKLVGYENVIEDYWKKNKKGEQEENSAEIGEKDGSLASTSIDMSNDTSEGMSIVEECCERSSLDDEAALRKRIIKKRKSKTLDDIVRQISSANSDHSLEKRADRLSTLDETLSSGKISSDLDEPEATSEVIPSMENTFTTNTYWSGGRSVVKRTLRCHVCNEIFENEASVEEHLKNHETCSICCEQFKTRASLEEHQRNAHKTSRQRFLECRYCSTLYAHPKQLEMHERRHFEGGAPNLPPPLMMLDEDSVEYPTSTPATTTEEERGEEAKNPMRNLLARMYHNQRKQSEFSAPRFDSARRAEEFRKSEVKEERGSPVYMKQEEEGDYPCPECNKTFGRKETFELHWQSEHLTDSTCRLCGKMVCKEQLQSHLATHFKLSCDICNKPFEDQASVENHMRVVHAVDGHTLSPRANYRSKMQTHMSGTPFQCLVCSQVFKRPDALSFHMLEEHNIKASTLPVEELRIGSPEGAKKSRMFDKFEVRGDIFPNYEKGQLSPANYNRRLIQTMKVSPHPLYMNEPGFFNKEGLPKLLEKATDPYRMSSVKPSSSLHCSPHKSPSYQFPSPLHQPPTQKRTPPSMLFQNGLPIVSEGVLGGVNILPRTECNKCGENFTSASLYDIHMQSHMKQAYSCDKCPKTFNKRNRYEAHKQAHENGKSKSHNCPYCHRLFSMKGNLRRHIRIHTNEAPYECPICFQRFRRSDGLKGHIRRHETLGESAPTDAVPTQTATAST